MPDDGKPPVSNVGNELVELVRGRGVWVFFFPTKGAGVAPWRGLVIYDTTYKGDGQTETHGRVSLVAHELTHVLQRDLADPQYWPSGLPNPKLYTRWITDSTNYMEVIAYMIQWTVEYDLLKDEERKESTTKGRDRTIKNRLRVIEHDLATLTSRDARNAARLILQKYPNNYFYKQNHRKEFTVADRRIPSGGWQHWLKILGFSPQVSTHIRQIAARGTVIPVDEQETNETAEVEKLQLGSKRRLAKTLKRVAKREINRRFDLAIGAVGALIVLLAILRIYAKPIVYSASSLAYWLLFVVEWVGWVGIGAIVASAGSLARTFRKRTSREQSQLDWRGLLAVTILSMVLIVLLINYRPGFSLDFSLINTSISLNHQTQLSLPWMAFLVGFFYQVISNFLEIIKIACEEGFLAPFIKAWSSKELQR
jgi:hypothetical protein